MKNIYHHQILPLPNKKRLIFPKKEKKKINPKYEMRILLLKSKNVLYF